MNKMAAAGEDMRGIRTEKNHFYGFFTPAWKNFKSLDTFGNLEHPDKLETF